MFWEMSPAGVPVYENVSVPPTMTFLTITVPCFVFVKVQVTVSPASTLKRRGARSRAARELPSSQEMLVSAQPALAASIEVYWPGATACEIVPLFTAIAPEGVPE